MENRRLSNIIEALSIHEDSEAVNVLRDLGTNCANDEVREATARALIARNSRESLSIVISEKGKGINDMSTSVAMSAINELMELKDKAEAIALLEQTAESHSEDEVRETARSVRALITFAK